MKVNRFSSNMLGCNQLPSHHNLMLLACLIARQEGRFPRYIRVVEEASRVESCVRNMPVGDLNGLNRGTRRQPSALRRLTSDPSFSSGWSTMPPCALVEAIRES
mmetsp:Transcript_44432/g.60683  ORF Transcript_44432/g.60683 Transcript_44432/m.60683 type:complete len:104 (+) Transcript_44432:323-634(+)